MAEKKLYVCKDGLRPPVRNGAPVFIPPGSPFEEGVIDDATFKAKLANGTIYEYVKPKVQEPEVFTAPEKGGGFVKAPAKKKKAAEKPSGIFNFKAEELEVLDLNELDSIHADICSEHGFPAPLPFKTKEEAIEKLTSEA